MSALGAAYLGGAVCYAGVLLTPRGPRLNLLGIAFLALIWPASIILAHDASGPEGQP